MLAEMYKDVYSDIPFDRMGSLTYIKSHKNVYLYGPLIPSLIIHIKEIKSGQRFM